MVAGPVTMNRRHFSMLSAGTALWAAGRGVASTGGKTYFALRSERGRPWLVAPDGSRFFARGLNAPAPEAARSVGEIRRLERFYGRDAREWLAGSRPCAHEQGGFNVSGLGAAARGVPYCHVVPFSEAHRWDSRTRQCDYLHRDWDEWCDEVARAHCEPRADDPGLVGYFYSAGPCWRQDGRRSEWRGPLYDPGLLKSRAGRRKLRALARRYYDAARSAIRRHDRHHLILGDRYESTRLLPAEVWEEAVPRVDVLSFQAFSSPAAHLRAWHARTGMPVLLADTAPPDRHPGGMIAAAPDEAAWYAGLLRALIAGRGCVGCHLTASAAALQDGAGSWREWRAANGAAERRLAGAS